MDDITEREKLAIQVYIAEYSALRKEVELRLTWQTLALSVALPFIAGLFLAATNAMGKTESGTALWSEQYALYLGLASLGSSLIGLLVCNQDLMIIRIGSYLRSELASEVMKVTGQTAFAWESYHPAQQMKGAKLLAVTPHALLLIAAGVPLAAFIACFVSVGTGLGAYKYAKPNISHWMLIGFATVVFAVFVMALTRAYFVAKQWKQGTTLHAATLTSERTTPPSPCPPSTKADRRRRWKP